MFDAMYRGGTQNSTMNINAVSGLILKNHPQSWFERFNLKSERAGKLLREGGDEGHKMQEGYSGHIYTVPNDENACIVLQMMVCGDMEVVAEVVYKKDFVSKSDTEKDG